MSEEIRLAFVNLFVSVIFGSDGQEEKFVRIGIAENLKVVLVPPEQGTDAFVKFSQDLVGIGVMELCVQREGVGFHDDLLTEIVNEESVADKLVVLLNCTVDR